MISGIPGPALAGLSDVFEESYGDPDTERGMPTVTPSFVGWSMLPHRCPRCGEVAQEMACPKTREHYTDRRPGRGNVWCPRCCGRYRLRESGGLLRWAIPAGAMVGPSLVEEADGRRRWQDAPGVVGATIGAVLGAAGDALAPSVEVRALAGERT